MAHPLGLALLLGARCANGGFHLFHFFGRRKHGGHAQRLDRQLAAPALGVVEVVVFLLFDRLVRGFQGLAQVAGGRFSHLAQQLPVGVVFGFGVHHAFGSHQLGRRRVCALLGHLHGLHQRFANVLDHLACGRLRVEIGRAHV